MALIIEYEDPDLGFIDITGYIKWGEGNIRLTMTAEQGTVNTDSITVEDPEGIFDFVGLRNFSVKESESEFERIYIGWTWLKHVSRGDYYRTGPGRIWELELQDINHRLYQNVMAGNDTDRPAETDVERIQWLLTTGEASGITDTTTYVFTDRPVDMDANPDAGYNGQMFNQVVDDCAQQSGKNYYIIDILDDYLGYKLGIWYGHDDLDEFVSEATISNVLADVDNVTTFWADVPAKLDRDPSRVYSGVFGNFDGGWVYRQRPATVLQFTHRDTIANWPNVKTEAKANARADRMLLDLAKDGEEDSVTCTIYSMLPSQANVFRAGHRVNGVKFSHFPGWESGRDVRIVRKTIIDQSEQFYAMELDLLPIGTPVPSGTCSTAIIAAEETANLDIGGTFGPVSIPVGAASFDSAQQIMVWCYSGPLLGIGGTSISVGGGWDELNTYDVLGSHTWIGVGNLYQATVATPPNMTVTATSSGGGFAEGFGIGVAFPTSSTAPIQQSGLIDGTGPADLPNPPTEGNILFVWAVGETGTLDAAQFIADGGVMIVDNENFNNGQPGGVYISMGMRCVGPDETGLDLHVPSNSYSHWQGVSEWAP